MQSANYFLFIIFFKFTSAQNISFFTNLGSCSLKHAYDFISIGKAITKYLIHRKKKDNPFRLI